MNQIKFKSSFILLFSYLIIFSINAQVAEAPTPEKKVLCQKSINVIFHGDEKTPLRNSAYIPSNELAKLLEKSPDFSDKWSIDQHKELVAESKEITSVNTFIVKGKNCPSFEDAWQDLELNLSKVARTLVLSEFALRDNIVGIESKSPQKMLYSFTRIEDNSTIKATTLEMITSKVLGDANEDSVEVELASVVKTPDGYEWEISGAIESKVAITRAHYILAPDLEDARLYK